MSGDGRPVMLVTGATGSIGSAVARLARADGWRLVLHGRDSGKLGRVADGAVTVAVDLACGDGAARTVALAADAVGRLDGVIDCVSLGAVGTIGPFANTSPASYDEQLALSLGHVQRLAHAALPYLSKQGGTFVAMASDAGRFAAPNQSVIGGARAGTIGFIRNLAVEVARCGVRAHCICPGFVAASGSACHKDPRVRARFERAEAKAGLGLPTADDVADLALFLCSDRAARMTGQVISINGGINA